MAGNTAVQAAGGVVSRLATLAFYAVLAREVGQTGFGDFSFALALALVIAMAGFGTDYAVMREVARDRDRMHEVFWHSIAIKLCFGAIGMLIVVGVGFLGGYDAEVRTTIAILGLATLLEVLARTVHATFRGVEDMAPIALGLVLQQAWTAAVGITVLSLGAGLVTAALAYLSGALVALAYVTLRLLGRGLRPRLYLSVAAARALMWDSLPLALGTIFITVLARADSAILSFIQGNAAVGLYAAAYKLFEGTTFLTWVFGTALFPVFARLGKDTTPTVGEALETGLKALAIGLTPLAVVFITVPEPLITLFYGQAFTDSVTAMRLLGASTVLWGFFTISMYALATEHRQRIVAYLLGVGLFVNIGLNVALIPRYSYAGAAAAMTVSLAVIATTMTAAALRASEHPLRVARVAAGPLLGAVMAGVSGSLFASEPLSLLLAIAVYAAVLFVFERRFFPADIKLIGRSLRRRPLAA